ncbi:protein phosphatase 2C domain-containing protein [Streptomyces sp. NPDC007084]|uniref:protein phosphatase 2C domain-containing protein n=1 Tax=Streptomyces sp. NPDC007084 TaxID=3154313 RepID=UPI003453224A
MRTELVSEPGDPGRPNEDFASVGLPASGQGGSLVVLDGVTPPGGDYGCRHSVEWFTARLGGALTELSLSQGDVTLREVLAAAIRRVAEAHAGTCDLSHPRTPQATVVLARWSAAAVEYLVLSDSVLLVESPSGEVTALVDDRLALVPRALLVSDAVADSTVRNKEGGFFTAAADPAVAARAVTGTLPRASVRTLTALTDGAARWVEKFEEGDWGDLFTLVRKEGPAALVARVRALERADAAERRLRLGRSKTHDDATVVFAEL